MRESHSQRRRATALLTAASIAAVSHATWAGTSTVPDSNTTSLRPAGQTIPTVSLSGSTALRNFLTSPGMTLLTSGTSITLGDGSTDGMEITYSAPAGNGVSYQLAPGNFTTPDTVTGNIQSNSALRTEYHEAGSVEGVYELVDSQINGSVWPDKTIYNPNTTQAVWINRSKFGGNSPTGPIPTAGTPATLNGFNLNYQSATGARDSQSQSPVQIGVSDTASFQAFSITGTANAFATPGTPGYGLGNPALATVPLETFQSGGRYQLKDQHVADMPAGATNPSYNPNSPRSGPATYGVGAWNTAGYNNLVDTKVAVTATLFAANPGTGLEHLNRTDSQWLLTTGRLQNGADFNVTTRDLGSGTRNVSANNVGLDPSWAVGENDNGNGNAPDGGTAQISIGPGLTFSNKTSGGAGLRPTVINSRMAVGTLGLSDAIKFTKNSSSQPLRALAYRDDANDVADNSNGASFKNWGEDASGNPVFTAGDLPSHQFVMPSAQNITNGSYVIYQNETFVTARVPTADMYNKDVIKGDNGVGVQFDASGKDVGPGHDVRDFRDNILNAVASQPFPTTTSVANPADALLANSYIVPQLMLVQKSQDGLNQSSVNPNYNSQYRNQVFLPAAATAVNFNPDDPATVTSGVGSTYGSAGTNTALFNGQIAITSQNYLFGNFNQNGTRDFSAIKTAVAAQAALASSGAGVSMFTADGGQPTSTAVTTGIAALDTMNGGMAATKGDLIVLGDYNGDGKFNGQDLYLMARGAALADNAGTDRLTTASGATFGDQVRNGVLLKNQALDYLQAHATAQQRIDASASLANDPTGSNAFNKFDVNRDGLISLNDAAVVDKFVGSDYRNLSDQLSATVNTDGSVHTGPQRPISLVDVELNDNGKITATIGQDGTDTSDFKLIRDALGSQLIDGDSNFDNKVDFSDLLALAQHYGQTDGAKWSTGDFNLDGKVDFTDLLDLAQHYGAGTPTAGQLVGLSPALRAEVEAAFADVPEPGMMSAVAVFVGMLARRRRR